MSKYISLHRLLSYFNFIFLCLMWGLFLTEKGNPYVNTTTVFLGSTLILEVLFFLSYSKKMNNSLLLVLSFLLTFFFIFRIITLIYTPFVTVFLRYNDYSYESVNYTLLFIIISNIALFLGIAFVGKRKVAPKINFNYNKKGAKAIIIMLIFAVALLFFESSESPLIIKITSYCRVIFINIYYILLASIVYVLAYKEYINKKTLLLIYSLILVFVLGVTLGGSRSGLLTIVTLIGFAILSVKLKIKLKQKDLLILGVVTLLAGTSFLLASAIRRDKSGELSFSELIEANKNSYIDRKVSETINSSNFVKIKLTPIFDRMGFLDYATEMVNRKKEYQSVFNWSYYGKSIVDNVISPGFNVFDVPRVSNALVFIYGNRGSPDLKMMTVENYHSDQLTIYGELYNMFGKWFSIVFFFFVGILFQSIMSVGGKDPFFVGLKNAFTLCIFYTFINSFGLDWLLMDVISLFLTYYIFRLLFR